MSSHTTASSPSSRPRTQGGSESQSLQRRNPPASPRAGTEDRTTTSLASPPPSPPPPPANSVPPPPTSAPESMPSPRPLLQPPPLPEDTARLQTVRTLPLPPSPPSQSHTDQSIPDYPPPSFEDAIASPHVPPHLASPPPSLASSTTALYSNPSVSQHPYASHVPSSSSATLLSSPNVYHHSPALSQLSLARPLDPQPVLDSSQPSINLNPSAAASTSTLLSSAATTATSHSTALSDLTLLRPPRPRPAPPSPLTHPDPRPAPTTSPIRLTSPSTTTLISSATAVRDSPALPRVALTRPQHSLHSDSESEDEDADSLLVEPLPLLSPPSSPHPHHRGSFSTVTDLVEELSFEPYQRWSADRRLGYTLEQRVQREFERRNTQEAREAFGMGARSAEREAPDGSSAHPTPSSSIPSTPPASPGPYARRRCSHCGSVQRPDCGETGTIDEHSDEEDPEEDDEDEFSVARHSSPLARGAGKSPYLHPAPTRAHMRARFGSNSPEPGSPPASPLSPSMSIFKMPSAWASSVTLSLANALGPHKSSASSSASSTPPSSTASSPASGSGNVSPPGTGLKRKESFGVKRLFGTLKGKEREREYAQLPRQRPSVSASSSESCTESVDGWEVVGGDSPSSSAHSSATSGGGGGGHAPTSPTSPARSAEAHSPTSEGARAAAGAFLNRPVRHRPAGPAPSDGPAPPVVSPLTLSSATRPYLPEKSPLRLIASANHLRNTTQTLNSPVAPNTPRPLRPSPSVVWKSPGVPTNAVAALNSPVQRSPLSQPSYQPHIRPPPPFPQPLQSPTGPRASPASAPGSPSLPTLRTPETPSPLSQSVPMLRESMPALPAPSPGPNPAQSMPAQHALQNPPLRRRRAITPPPAHRHVMLACDTTTAAPAPAYDEAAEMEDGAPGEPDAAPARLSIEQLMDRQSPSTPTRTPTTPSRAALAAPPTPVTPASTPTTPTFAAGAGGLSQHYRGRPLPPVPSSESDQGVPVKRVPDGAPVNRVPELQVSGPGEDADVPPPPPPVPTSASERQAPPSAQTLAPPPQMARSDSGESVMEEARAAEEGPRAEFLEITDLDVLASRLVEGQRDGRHYEVCPSALPPHPPTPPRS
ncbi:hypothetical protein BC628DRAFT_384675 [Trametes gibbosa]|nr:hypothetical protein BC628DRAFT_384675 [Trametes gibbosa]